MNLIDTPGHSDFAYEVSRALNAVEGGILLVDGTKGIQAQTLSNLRGAQKAGLRIIPAVNKIDLALPHIEKVVEATAELLGISPEDVFRVSAKTGAGVKELLEAVVKLVPPPNKSERQCFAKALIFDSMYDDHKGIIANVRVFGGEFTTEDMHLVASADGFKAKEVGIFFAGYEGDRQSSRPARSAISRPDSKNRRSCRSAIPFLRIAIPPASAAAARNELRLPGYREPAPVVFISFYPDGDTKFDDLKRGVRKVASERRGAQLRAGFERSARAGIESRLSWPASF